LTFKAQRKTHYRIANPNTLVLNTRPPESGVIYVTMHTVAIVEDDESIRERFSVIYDSAFYQDSINWFTEHEVDVLLVDLGLPDGKGSDLIRFCRSRYPSMEIMIVSVFVDERNVLDAIEAGANAPSASKLNKRETDALRCLVSCQRANDNNRHGQDLHKSIYSKLEVHNRGKAIYQASLLGIPGINKDR